MRDRVVAVEDADLGAVRVEHLALHGLERRAGDAARPDRRVGAEPAARGARVGSPACPSSGPRRGTTRAGRVDVGRGTPRRRRCSDVDVAVDHARASRYERVRAHCRTAKYAWHHAAVLVCALGDLMLDVIARLDGPLAPRRTTRTATSAPDAGRPGGQRRGLGAALGGADALIAKRAADARRPARRGQGLAARGVERPGPAVDGRAGVVVSLVTPDGERTMLSDRGVAPDLAPGEIDPAWLRGRGVAAHLRLRADARADRGGRRCGGGARAGARRARRASTSRRGPRSARFGAPAFASASLRSPPTRLRQPRMELDVLGGPPAPTWVHQARRRGGAVAHATARLRPSGADRRVRRCDRRGRCVRGGRSARRLADDDGMALGLGPRARCVEQAWGDAVNGLLRRRRRGRRGAARRPRRRRARDDARGPRLPAREGVEVALDSERAVREAGAVPATVGVVDGRVRVGLGRGRARALRPRAPRRASSARATSPPAPCRARSARRPWAARSPSRGASGSASWPRAASAACTAASPRRPTCRPTWPSSRARRRSSSARASSRCSTCRRRPSCSRRSACPCSAGTRQLPLFYQAAGGPPVSARAETPAEAAAIARAHWRLGGAALLLGRPPDESSTPSR